MTRHSTIPCRHHSHIRADQLVAGQMVRYHPAREWEQVATVRTLLASIRVEHVGSAPRITSPSARVEVAL